MVGMLSKQLCNDGHDPILFVEEGLKISGPLH